MKVLKITKQTSATDLALMVDSTSKLERTEYDEGYIKEALIKEINCSEVVATEVAALVTEKLNDSKLQVITTSFIRQLVNMVLLEKGYDKELKSNAEVTIPFYDITELIEHANKENGNTTHNPESINLAIAEKAIKEYALKTVFDEDVSKAHMIGEIHIHDLGMINRYYCSGHSPEYVKKHGIKDIPSIPTNSKPANSANVLARHICSMTQFLSGQFAGAIGWEAVNVFFAPLLVDMS